VVSFTPQPLYPKERAPILIIIIIIINIKLSSECVNYVSFSLMFYKKTITTLHPRMRRQKSEV
jgi:hypothetical protein